MKKTGDGASVPAIQAHIEASIPMYYIQHLQSAIMLHPEVKCALLRWTNQKLAERISQGSFSIELNHDRLNQRNAYPLWVVEFVSEEPNLVNKVCSSVFEKLKKKGLESLCPVAVFPSHVVPKLWDFLVQEKALTIYKATIPVSLENFQQIADDMYRTIETCPPLWNGLLVYWYKWRTKQIVRVLRNEATSRLHVHVSPFMDLKQITRRLLVLSDGIILWYGGPLSATITSGIPSHHPEDKIRSANPVFRGYARPLPPHLYSFFKESEDGIRDGRIFYSPLALVHAPVVLKEDQSLELGLLSKYIDEFKWERPPVETRTVQSIIDIVGKQAWDKIEQEAKQMGPPKFAAGWWVDEDKPVVVDKGAYPDEQVIRWEADIASFCGANPLYGTKCHEQASEVKVFASVKVPYLDNVPMSTLLKLMRDEQGSFEEFRKFIREASQDALKQGTDTAVTTLERKLKTEAQRLKERYKEMITRRSLRQLGIAVKEFGIGLGLLYLGLPPATLFLPAVNAVNDIFNEVAKEKEEGEKFKSDASWFLWRLSMETKS